MNRNNIKLLLAICIGIFVGFFAANFFNKYEVVEKNATNKTEVHKSDKPTSENSNIFSTEGNNIDELTAEDKVIDCVKEHHELPEYYITKSEARNQGWNASAGNLCDVLPGRAIGGDKFSNRERQLPKGEQYYEADVNYNCGHRNADRIVFTKSGDVWLTHNHYKSFEKQ